MSDQQQSIFQLWSREQAVRAAGKWPTDAPGVARSFWSINRLGQWEEMVNAARLGRRNLSLCEIDAAMWRIVQLVMWAKDAAPISGDIGHESVCDGVWYEATPADWIAEASAVLERMEHA